MARINTTKASKNVQQAPPPPPPPPVVKKTAYGKVLNQAEIDAWRNTYGRK